MKPSLLARLEHQSNALTHLLGGLTEEQIRQQPLPGKWSIFENIAHLGRYQEVFLERISKLVEGKKPVFDRYVADFDPGFANWTTRSLEENLRNLRQERRILFALSENLADWQLQQVGVHPVYGTMTVEGWAEFFLLHEAHHLFTILKLAGQLRSPDQPMG